MYNQTEAWYVLYKKWKKARRYRYLFSNNLSDVSTSPNGYENGICITAAGLLDNCKISQKVYDAIIYKIDKEKKKLRGVLGVSYIWPRDGEGKKARVAFCLRQYKEMKRKR